MVSYKGEHFLLNLMIGQPGLHKYFCPCSSIFQKSHLQSLIKKYKLNSYYVLVLFTSEVKIRYKSAL